MVASCSCPGGHWPGFCPAILRGSARPCGADAPQCCTWRCAFNGLNAACVMCVRVWSCIQARAAWLLASRVWPHRGHTQTTAQFPSGPSHSTAGRSAAARWADLGPRAAGWGARKFPPLSALRKKSKLPFLKFRTRDIPSATEHCAIHAGLLPPPPSSLLAPSTVMP